MNSEVKEINALAKISCEINNVWYTISYGETRTVTSQNILPEERKDLQDFVFDEVAKQVENLINSVEG